MRINFLNFLIIVLVIGITSCSDFSLSFPISNSNNSKVDQNLIGNWMVLDANDSIKYPIMQTEILKFNEKEYIAICKRLGDQGRNINSVFAFKIFNSRIKDKEFLNLQSLNDPENRFTFYRIEENFIDSIHLRVITDSLKRDFKDSNEFRTFLENEDDLIEKGILSNSFSFYRWNSVNWDEVNITDKSINFDSFFLFGRINEEEFMKLSDYELEELIKNKSKAKIQNLELYFKKINLISYSKGIWKVPKYGVIKLNSGKLIKIKYGSITSNFMDLTNRRLYVNSNEIKIN